jgi:hypothetical protein
MFHIYETQQLFAVLIASFHWLPLRLERMYFHILLHFIKINFNIILRCVSVAELDFSLFFTATFYVFAASPILALLHIVFLIRWSL